MKKKYYRQRSYGKTFEQKLLDALLWPLEKILIRFRSKKIGHAAVTNKGERVKSLKEKRIANFFYKKGINYVYEKPLRVWFFKKIDPDFYLPDYDLYIEYHGMWDHPEYGRRYQAKVRYKQRHYRRLGIRILELYPDNDDQLEALIESEIRGIDNVVKK